MVMPNPGKRFHTFIMRCNTLQCKFIASRDGHHSSSVVATRRAQKFAHGFSADRRAAIGLDQ